jgi:hypothetical protein
VALRPPGTPSSFSFSTISFQAPLLACVNRIKETVPVFNPNRHQNFEFSARRSMQRLVKWWDLVLRRPLLFRKDKFRDSEEVGMSLSAKMTARGEAGIPVVVSAIQLDIESDHYALVLADFEMRPHLITNRVLSDNLLQFFDPRIFHCSPPA